MAVAAEGAGVAGRLGGPVGGLGGLGTATVMHMAGRKPEDPSTPPAPAPAEEVRDASPAEEPASGGGASPQQGPVSGAGSPIGAVVKRPGLLQQARAAGAGDAIDDADLPGKLEVFAHGTTAESAAEIISTEGDALSSSGGNFGGKFFAVPSLDVADVFARRAVSRAAAGAQPAIVGIALPEDIVRRLASGRNPLLRSQPIPNPPPGVSPGAVEWVFEPAALEIVKRRGFFFLLQ